MIILFNLSCSCFLSLLHTMAQTGTTSEGKLMTAESKKSIAKSVFLLIKDQDWNKLRSLNKSK